MICSLSNEAAPARPVQLDSPAFARPTAELSYTCPACGRLNEDGRDGCHPRTPDGYY
jgi:hypothetical protein